MSASDPGVGASRRPGVLSGPQTGAEGFESLAEPDNPAAYALARHIADHPMPTIYAAFRYLNAPLTVELREDPDAPAAGDCTCGIAGDAFRPAGHYRDCPEYAPTARTTPDNSATSGDTADNSLRQRIARAIHRYDNRHALCGNDIASQHHLGEADAVLAELNRELDALAEYENTINWHTTCTSCARILDSAHRETERAEKAEAAIERVRALHIPRSYPNPDAPGEITFCVGCDDATSAHPCNTLAALHPPAPATEEQP